MLLPLLPFMNCSADKDTYFADPTVAFSGELELLVLSVQVQLLGLASAFPPHAIFFTGLQCTTSISQLVSNFLVSETHCSKAFRPAPISPSSFVLRLAAMEEEPAAPRTFPDPALC